MSKNDTYTGGHTVVHQGSGWFSSGRYYLKEKNFELAKQRFMKDLVRASIGAGEYPTKYPEEHQAGFDREVKNAGGIEEWAKRQSGYARFLKLEKRKLDKKQKRKEEESYKKSDQYRIDQLCIARTKKEIQLKKAELTLKSIKDSIVSIDNQLSDLKQKIDTPKT